ncbi:MAG TPA: FAD-dependent oxidoreductase, partial [Thermoleophilia bacterium]|nr:FAD-dependent oxidoreductase [Thermoleophilia bacterium]
MHETRLLIIGAGVAGLTAGCYAARSGYRTTILEMGQTPGGLCTSWRRKGYLFDGSVAGLAGTSPEAPIHRLWRDIGVADYCPLYDPVDFGTVVAPDGRAVTVSTDIDRLEAHLRENFPRDAAAIGEFARALRACLHLDIPFRAETGLAGIVAGAHTGVASLRSLPALVKYGRLTLRRFNARLRDPFCRQVFDNLVHFGGQDVPMLTVLLPIAYAHRRMTGIPRDGWLAFGRAIERRFLELGGEIRYGAKVEHLETGGGA